jgi:hypothetical protein
MLVAEKNKKRSTRRGFLQSGIPMNLAAIHLQMTRPQ